MDRFACRYCGTELLVQRRGATVSLKPVQEAIRRVQVGTDRTAAELAIARYEKELLQLQKEQAAVQSAAGDGLSGFLIGVALLGLLIVLIAASGGRSPAEVYVLGVGFCLAGAAGLPVTLKRFRDWRRRRLAELRAKIDQLEGRLRHDARLPKAERAKRVGLRQQFPPEQTKKRVVWAVLRPPLRCSLHDHRTSSNIRREFPPFFAARPPERQPPLPPHLASITPAPVLRNVTRSAQRHRIYGGARHPRVTGQRSAGAGYQPPVKERPCCALATQSAVRNLPLPMEAGSGWFMFGLMSVRGHFVLSSSHFRVGFGHFFRDASKCMHALCKLNPLTGAHL